MSRFVRIAVSLALLGWIGSKIDWPHVWDLIIEGHPEYLFAAVGLLLASQLVSVWRWQMLAHKLDMPGSYLYMAGCYFVGMFFNMVLPTSVGGDVVRAMYLTRRWGKKLQAFVSVLFDRVNGLYVLVLLACIATPFVSVALPWWVPVFVYGSALGSVAGMVLFLSSGIGKLHPKGAALLERFHAMAPVLRCPRLMTAMTTISVFVQVANVGIVWLVGLSLGLDVPFSYYWILAPMVTLLTLLPVSLNGMGIREGATVLFLAPLGVDQTSAATLAFLWFLVYVSLSLASGLVFAFGRFPKPVSEEAPVNHGPVNRDSDQGRAGEYPKAA